MANVNSLPVEMTYSDVINQVTRFYGSSSDPWYEVVINSPSENPTRLAEEYLQEAGIKVIRTPSGRNVTYARSTVLDSYNSSPISTPNSNTTAATTGGNARRALINGSATTTTEAGTKTTTFSKGAKAAGTGSKVMTVVSEASWLVGAARAGGWLGLQFSQALYDHGVSWAWSKEDWADFITNDADDLDSAVLSFLTGIDANGNSTEYMDELAVAQMYMTLRDMGVYGAGNVEYGDPPVVDQVYHANDFTLMTLEQLVAQFFPTVTPADAYYWNKRKSHTALLTGKDGSGNLTARINSDDDTPSLSVIDNDYTVTSVTQAGVATVSPAVSYNGGPTRQVFVNENNQVAFGVTPSIPTTLTNENDAYSILVNYAFNMPIEGIDRDPEADTYIDPNLIDGQDRDTVLQQLKQNYPELFDGSIYQDVPQDDGTNQRITYVPVPYVKPSAQPVTGNNHQNNPSVNPETNTDTDLEDLIKTITELLTPNDVPDTGDGDTPTVLPPTGSASSLWAVYNPTQAQVDSFGGWLWSSNFVEQLKKLFADPMQAIIGIHKVFATPATGATQTIVCGYLDSEVPSKIVTSQYTTVNCGTVNLREYFGNVFDYSPYTEVSLYLPFIGIVRLDVSDVMRASITVKYHVDVITGACLADVVVNRDGAGGVLYQYAGSAIVTYPISSGSYASAVGGILSIAGGIAATVLTGGAAAPAVLGAAAGISHLHTDVQKSGSFSGAAGAMGSKKPYIIISRPQTGMPSSFKHLQGYPVNYYTKLGDCTVHVRVSDVQVKGVNATDTELDMIRDVLMQGIEI